MNFDAYKNILPKTKLIVLCNGKPHIVVCPDCHDLVKYQMGELHICPKCSCHFIVPEDTCGVGWPD